MSRTDVLPDPDAAATTLLAAITSGLSLAREPRLLRARFEEELRMLVHAQSVAVRDHPSEPSAQPAVVRFDVPGAPWASPAWLEATFEPAQPVDDWQRRTLSVAAHVASLLVQIEYASGRWGRPRRADGAAPLIGSSTAIRLVRERIERVSATDFTVLIEGESGPQPHPGFVEVFGEAAVGGGHREVAGADDAGGFECPMRPLEFQGGPASTQSRSSEIASARMNQGIAKPTGSSHMAQSLSS